MNTPSVAQVRGCELLQEDSHSITFGNLLDCQPPEITRTLIIFIRHFFCGNCQEYIRRLSTDLSPTSLPKDLSVIIVGCGAPSLIKSYVRVTKCPYPIYADPSTEIYKLLGMQRTLSLGSKGPAYIHHSLATGVVKSIVQGLKRIPAGDVMQAGHLDVNGGEFLFERTLSMSDRSTGEEDWHIRWSHYMRNSRDHAEVKDVREAVLTTGHPTIKNTHPDRKDNGRGVPANNKRRSLSIAPKTWIVDPAHVVRSASLGDAVG